MSWCRDVRLTVWLTCIPRLIILCLECVRHRKAEFYLDWKVTSGRGHPSATNYAPKWFGATDVKC